MAQVPMTPLADNPMRDVAPESRKREGATITALHDADEEHKAPIGRILVNARRLPASEVSRVLDVARRDKVRFGEAAVRLRLIRREDVDFALARQFGIACLNPDESSVSQEVVAAYRPNEPAVEQLRMLRGEIIVRACEDLSSPLALALVSPERGDGRSFAAANLAVLFAQSGRSTLLIDASLRTACLHQWFGISNSTGLSSVLAERSDLSCLRPVAEVPGLHLLPAGPMPPNCLELLERPRFATLLADLQQRFDVILIDTPAGSMGGDAGSLARLAGCALLVARANHNRRAQAHAFALRLEQARTRVLGVVFNALR